MLIISLFYLISMAINCQALSCSIRLPQDEPPPCKRLRRNNLKTSRATYGLRRATPEMPYNRLDMSTLQYYGFVKTNQFLARHARMYIGHYRFGEAVSNAYIKSPFYGRPEMTMKDFAVIMNFYKKTISSRRNPFRAFMRAPSNYEPFQKDFTKWVSDDFFADQRLAGVNPLAIQKITLKSCGNIGMNFKSLKQLLNLDFDWIKAVNKALCFVDDEASLKKAIKKGKLFVVYHPLASDVQSSTDLTDKDPKRKLWQFNSPIAIFASSKVGGLRPVAIQMDDKKDSPVYTPKDGDNWMLAKLNFQLSDMLVSQIVEHLNKLHFTMEAVCLSLERQLSTKHPLYDIMRFHCRGIFSANTLGSRSLLDHNKTLDLVYAFGNEGAIKLTKKAAAIINWYDLDLRNNLKRRGVDDKKNLPYYPFRDDGLVISNVLKKMVFDYVRAFYKSDRSVRKDYELQNFANEISKDGKGEIFGFPARINSKAKLVDTFAQILWLMIGQHASVNYPLYDYGMYLPNSPAKLYNVKGVPSDKFTAARLPNRLTSVYQSFFFSILGTLRYDRLFDYGPQLKTTKGKTIVNRYKCMLDNIVDPMLEKRNQRRLKEGHLTYPYFQPRWLPNGVQS